MIAGLAARAAATGGLAPGQICFTAVLSLARAAVTADTTLPPRAQMCPLKQQPDWRK